MAIEQGNEIKYLVTMFPEREDSWMFHHPCIELTRLQAEALEIKQIAVKTKGEKEKELEDLKKTLKEIKEDVEGVVSGAVESTYQKSRIDKICKELGLESIAPLWHRNPERLLREEVGSGFEIIVTGVFAEGFDESWLGRKIDEECIEDLKKLSKRYGIHICGEGGEYDSLTLDCPLFKKKIRIVSSKVVWDKKTCSGYLSVKRAKLVQKG